MLTTPVSGLTNVERARPSQKISAAYPASIADTDERPVTWTPNPKTECSTGAPDASIDTTPGEPKMSSGDGLSASGPALTPMRGSVPPLAPRWQEPHATVSLLDSCSSQNRIFPRT